MNNPDKIVVSARDVTKKYRIFTSPKDRVKEALHPLRKRYHHDFWALKGVSFDIRKGQVIGILGQNGSGKSTLLQIIASVLTPTSGTLNVNGRVSALLELGTGFNPEFTGRQNVLLNGALMGVSHEEMLSRMPAITAFADIGEFFDQPMKTYSSGMFVRVAFAASIHVDPDILIIDEALAVGDAKFQYRCFQKLRNFHERGTTIILVTHAHEMVLRHCDRALLLNQGQLIVDGAPEAVVRQYIDVMEERKPSPPPKVVATFSAAEIATPSVKQFLSAASVAEAVNAFLVETPGADQCSKRATYNQGEHSQENPRAEIVDHLVICGDRVDPIQITSGEEIEIYVKVRFHANIKHPCFGIAVNSQDGVQIYALNSAWTMSELIPARAGDFRVVRFRLILALNSGDVFLDVGIDELRDARHYANICRRMGLVHLVIHCNKLFHGLADFRAIFSEQSMGGSLGDPVHE
ncbi:MAG: ABC transporter ATP-binding protein [Candidatus Binatia bacterium]